MVEVSELLSSILGEIKKEYYYHGQRVDQLKLEDYPFSCCNEFLKKLKEIDKSILLELDQLENELLQSTKKKEVAIKVAVEDIQRYGELVGVLHHVLTYFEIGHRQNLSEGMSVPIKKYVGTFDNKADFSLVPIFEFNYMYVDLMELLRTALQNVLPEKVESMLADMPSKYAVFGFPLIQKKNVIINAVLAHEVGHFADDIAKLSDKVLDKVVLDKRKVERIIKRLDKALVGERQEISLTQFLSPGTLKANITELAVEQITQWLKELVSDAIAFHLFGPIFLHSMGVFLLASVGVDEAEGDHPPPRMRIELLVDEFKEKKYAEALASTDDFEEKKLGSTFVDRVLEFEELMKQMEPSELDEFQELVTDSVKKVIPELKRVVNEYIVKYEYTPEQFKTDVFALSKLLGSLVPPAEIEVGSPAQPISILNSGFLFEMIFIESMFSLFEASSTQDKLIVKDKLHSLVLKALESTDIETQLKPLLKGSKS